MEYDYGVDALVNTFAEQADESDRITIELIEKLSKENPGIDFPPYLENKFNVCRALNSMCKEILKLKGQLTGHMRNEHPFS